MVMQRKHATLGSPLHPFPFSIAVQNKSVFFPENSPAKEATISCSGVWVFSELGAPHHKQILSLNLSVEDLSL
ncbi:hypothetical protein E2542_SST12737 [Spatholobus suberectus]|nr:hypothetical protein E2542_SST12737 [Spatholobus suberectus]